MRSLRLCLILLMVLSFSLSVSADTGGSVSGTIVDPTGAVVIGARVSLIRVDARTLRKGSLPTLGVSSPFSNCPLARMTWKWTPLVSSPITAWGLW